MERGALGIEPGHLFYLPTIPSPPLSVTSGAWFMDTHA